MRILSIMGSPRKEGNTSVLLETFLEGVQSNQKKTKITIVNPTEENINPCMGCNACKGGSPRTCVIEDDMTKYYEHLNLADVIVLATPVYWFNLSSQIKKFIDRMYGLDFKSFPTGKKLVLLMSFGDHDMVSSGAINISNSLKQLANFLGMEFAYEYGLSSNASEENKKKALAEIKEMGQTLLV